MCSLLAGCDLNATVTCTNNFGIKHPGKALVLEILEGDVIVLSFMTSFHEIIFKQRLWRRGILKIVISEGHRIECVKIVPQARIDPELA